MKSEIDSSLTFTPLDLLIKKVGNIQISFIDSDRKTNFASNESILGEYKLDFDGPSESASDLFII